MAIDRPETRLLFVYGTLMRAATSRLGTSERARLAEESRPLGAAHVRGRLYDLGGYPGLVPDSGAGAIDVCGELVELIDPAATFGWLDVYEGVSPGGGAVSDEYVRAVLAVMVGLPVDAAGGRARAQLGPGAGAAPCAWAYLHRGPTGGLRQLRIGHWVAS